MSRTLKKSQADLVFLFCSISVIVGKDIGKGKTIGKVFR